jgi:GNAT superfamily N-acetyltransferase
MWETHAMEPVISLEESATVAGEIRAGLDAWNTRFVPADGYRSLVITARDPDGGLLGGLLGGTYWGWLAIDRLWVREEARGSGLGSRLLAAAETEARRRGCQFAHLDTHDFQAPGFYHKHGYRECGRLEDLPPGHVRFLLRKTLDDPGTIAESG